MTDSNPFVPPTGLPAAAPPVLPPAPAAPVLPPPSGAPWTGFTAQPAPVATPPTPQWVKGVILAGAMVGLALAIGVGALLVQTVGMLATTPLPVSDGSVPQQPEAPLPPLPLLEGDPGQPVAADPLVCEGCFDIDDAKSLVLPAERYADLGLTEPGSEPWTGQLYMDQLANIRWWREAGGAPAPCYVTFPTSPLPVTDTPVPTAQRLQDVHVPVVYTDSYVRRSAASGLRVFDTSAEAVARLAEVAAARDSCPWYVWGDSTVSATVTAAPQLELPDSVAAVGWVEVYGSWREYTFEVQRGNLVARITLSTNTGGDIESRFRELVEEFAVMLADLEPSTP